MREDQPVKFYKAVALTFLCFTLALLGVILFLSSKRATIIIETKVEPVDVSGTVLVRSSGGEGALAGAVTTTVAVLSDASSPHGGKEVDAVATGMVTLHNDTDAAQALIQTTRLLSPDQVLFRLKQRVDIPARGTVVAAAYADKVGKASDIGPTRFTIPGLPLEKQRVIYATSDAPMTGGVTRIGIFTVDDKKTLEKRMEEKLFEEGKKKLAEAYPEGSGAYSLIQHTVRIDTEIGTETSSVAATGRGTVLGVFYDRKALTDHARRMLAERSLEDVETIQPREEDPTVTVENTDPEAGTATLKVFYTGNATLNPESVKIEKSVFFGKNRDEIRRYALSLDHVSGVEVDFSPAWVLRVPFSPDHVHVVVKSVE